MTRESRTIKETTSATSNGELHSQSRTDSDLNVRLREISESLLPKYGDNWSIHGLVTMKRMALSRVIYYYELYQKILDVPGVICEFGVQWGASLALLQNLRGMYEPYNVSRVIYGFDTFEGFSVIDEKDAGFVKVGDYSSLPGYENTLQEILDIQEQFSPVSHIRKHELIKGDASQTVEKWLEDNPHAIISMAIFDMDVYKPTRDVLEKILPRLTKGSILVFDELNCLHFPGETLALQEVLGIAGLRLKRHPHQTYCAWAEYEG